MKLIDADALKKEIERTFDMQDLYLPVHFLDLIDNAPTINPSFNLDNITEEDIKKFKIIWQRANSKGLLAINEERPQGEWITFPTSRLIMQCPECTAFLSRTRSDIFKDNIGEMNFCPNCGANMRGGAE